jgi:hypothetical protein
VPLNFKVGQTEIPLGLMFITITLFALCITNLFTKQVATVSGLIFTAVFFGIFELAEKYTHRGGQVVHAEMDQFNLELGSDLTPEAVGVQPGNILVPVSTYYTLYHLEAALRRTKGKKAEIVVLHVGLLRRAASGEYDLAPDQLFSSSEQLLFTKVLSIAEKEGKPVRLAVAAANDLWEGILRTSANLESSSIVLGSSSKMALNEQAREIGVSWERMGDPRPRDFLSRAARAAADSEGDRPAAQDLAEVERRGAGARDASSRRRAFRAGRSGKGTGERKRGRSSPAFPRSSAGNSRPPGGSLVFRVNPIKGERGRRTHTRGGRRSADAAGDAHLAGGAGV